MAACFSGCFGGRRTAGDQEGGSEYMEEQTEDRAKAKRSVFTINNFVKRIVWRQNNKDADTFIIIYGPRRSGKTTLGFQILISYLHAMRRQHILGKSEWKVPRSWKKLFTEYFAGDAEDMIRKIKNNPEKSFTFVDEGDDVLSWQHAMEKEQKDLNELILKAGKKKMLTILLVPSISLLQKTQLSNAHYMFIVPDEPKGDRNTAYLFKNHKNPILREKVPFGLKSIEQDVLKNKHLASNEAFCDYLAKRDRFITRFAYRAMEPKLYSLYDALVKEPLIMRERQRRRMVSLSRFARLQYAMDTILHNLYVHDDKNVSQIERLLRDKFGSSLVSRTVIKNHIDKMSVLQVKPIEDGEVLDAPEVQDLPEEDLLLEHLEGDVKTPDEREESKEQVDAK